MRVLCIKNEAWEFNGKPMKGPVYMEECYVSSIEHVDEGKYYYLRGYGLIYCYNADYFIPLTGDEAPELEEVVEEEIESV